MKKKKKSKTNLSDEEAWETFGPKKEANENS